MTGHSHNHSDKAPGPLPESPAHSPASSPYKGKKASGKGKAEGSDVGKGENDELIFYRTEDKGADNIIPEEVEEEESLPFSFIYDVSEEESEPEQENTSGIIDEDYGKEEEVPSQPLQDEEIPEVEENPRSVNAEAFEGADIYTEPYEEVIEGEGGSLLKGKYSPFLVKVMAFIVMAVIVIGIPLLLSSLRIEKEKVEEMIRNELGSGSGNEGYYVSIGNDSYETLKMTEHSSRFDTLDDLTFYLESNINATLSNEQALYNTYVSGECSKYYYSYTLNGYISFTDEMRHLLTANKSLYKEEGKEKVYDRLSGSVDVLMMYGDSIK